MSNRRKLKSQRATVQRLTLPAADVTLGDGRVLHYDGRQRGFARWEARNGLVGPAGHLNTPKGRMQTVGLSYLDAYPAPADIAVVQAAFFPAGVRVALSSSDDRPWMYLWEVPALPRPDRRLVVRPHEGEDTP